MKFHLDGLVDKELEGRLDADGVARLEAHRRECDVCRLEMVLRTSDDHVSIGELDALFDRLPSHKPRRARRRWVGAMVAMLVLTSSAFAAVRLWPSPETPEGPNEVEPTPREAAPVAETPVAETPVEQEPEPIEAVDPEPAPSVEPSPEPRPSASALFERANAARRAGERAQAIRLYRQVIRIEPRGERGLTSRVNLGRLLFRGQPRAALRQFQAYLRARPSGALAEEALVGKARALGRLGRGAEELEVWRELLRRFPNSVHTARARQRLEGSMQ
ncbi:MAG: tetratricopeptide repeat protein [Myxococcota bacterium]